MLTRCHDAWPGLKQEHMVMVRFPKGVPVCATWPQLEFSGLQSDAERRLGPVHTSPTHRCFSPVLTRSRCHKAGAVCNANPSHRDAPNLKLKCKGSPQLLTPSKKADLCCCQRHKQSCSGQKGRRKRAQVWLGRRREAAFRLKCFWSRKDYKQLRGIKNQRL